MTPQRLSQQYASDYRTLMLEAYERHPDAFTSSAAERAALPINWWESRLVDGPDAKEVVFGVLREGSLLGVAGLSFGTRERIHHKATLFGMYVPERHRRLGLGGKLVSAALAFARARPGLRVVQLTVTVGNRQAQSLYERHGFVQFGLEPYAVAVGTEYVAKSHMWCNLARASDEARV